MSIKRVGIIGLHGRQIPDIVERGIHADLSIYDKDFYTKESVSSFCNKADEVVFMAGHAPKGALLHCDRSKTHILPNGGLSTVLRFMTDRYGLTPTKPEGKILTKKTGEAPLASMGDLQLQKPVKDQPAAAPAQVEAINTAPTAASTTVDVGERQYLPLPQEWIGSMVGQTDPEYRIPPRNPIAVKLSATGRYDHLILEASQIGDTLRYERDPNSSLTDTIGRFTYVRTQYSIRLMQMLEIHIFKTYVDVYVSTVRVSSKDKVPRARYITSREDIHAMMGVEDDVVAADPASTGVVTATQSAGPKPGTLLRRALPAVQETQESEQTNVAPVAVQAEVVQESSAAPVEEAAPAPTPKTPLAATTTLSRVEEAFWRNVFLASVGNGKMSETAASEANAAVRYLRCARSGV